MTFATGSRHSLRYVAETGFGVTPADPALIELRHTACSLALTRNSLASEDIRSDRQLAHLLSGRKSVAGDVDTEIGFGALDDWLAAVMQADWSGDILEIGTSQPSFTIERWFSDISQYQQLTGCVLDRFSLSLRPDRLAAAKFSLLGRTAVFTDTPLDADPTAAPINDPMDSYSGSITEGGSSLALVAAADLVIDNNHTTAHVLGESGVSAVLPGNARISGELVTYFEDASLLDKFVNATASSLSLSLSGDGGSYDFFLPAIHYTGGDSSVAGEGPVTLNLPFTGLYDTTEGTSLRLTRTAD